MAFLCDGSYFFISLHCNFGDSFLGSGRGEFDSLKIMWPTHIPSGLGILVRLIDGDGENS